MPIVLTDRRSSRFYQWGTVPPGLAAIWVFIGLGILSGFNRPSLGQKALSQLVQSDNKLGFDVLRRLHQQDAEDNIHISPVSIGLALAITYNAAAGNTQQALLQALHLASDSDLTTVNQANLALNCTLQALNPDVQMTAANAIWVNRTTSLKPAFLKLSRHYWHAQVSKVDYRLPNAYQVINAWVKKNTQGKINRIIDKTRTGMSLLLTNAIYFKGVWSRSFPKAMTERRAFYSVDGRRQQVPMMRQRGQFPYLETIDFQVVCLPYGKTGRVAMLVFLPKAKSKLGPFINHLAQSPMETWRSQLLVRKGEVQLPRFTSAYKVGLEKVLRLLGMGVAFDPKEANFSNISNDKLYIGGVLHKVFIEVNEKGTEAAAVTAVKMFGSSNPVVKPKPPFAFIANHPFFYAIIDKQTHAILFMGLVTQPLKRHEGPH